MAKGNLTVLKEQLEEIRGVVPALKDEDLFVLWFLKAYVTDRDDDARKAITGASHDKGVDAVLVDDRTKIVFIVQGKYRRSSMRRREQRSDVMSFAQLAAMIRAKDDEFNSFCTALDPLVTRKLRAGRERVVDRGYRLRLCYVTLGRVSAPLEAEARRVARRGKGPELAKNADLLLFDGRRTLRLLDEYVAGVAPAIPEMELRVEPGERGTPAILSRSDSDGGITSWVFTMAGTDVADLFRQADVRIFAKNIRGWLGDTAINREMRRTLMSKEGGQFWHLNNGITLVCDGAELSGKVGAEVIRVSNPQIINGQQTTRVLDQAGKAASKASVLVRLIQIPPDLKDPERIVARVVQSTNWQNKIQPSDLMANDPLQAQLERELRKLGYQYLRKRMTKQEARRAGGSKDSFLVTKFELAQAVAGCLIEGLPLRVGKEPLFEPGLYRRIFWSRDPFFYLGRYWLVDRVKYVARTAGERKYSRWLVQYFAWRQLEPVIRRFGSRFREAGEMPKKHRKVVGALDTVIRVGMSAAWDFYRASRPMLEEKGVKQFFQREHLNEKTLFARFEVFWRSGRNRHRRRFLKARQAFEDALAGEPRHQTVRVKAA